MGRNGEVDAPPNGNSLRYSAGWYEHVVNTAKRACKHESNVCE